MKYIDLMEGITMSHEVSIEKNRADTSAVAFKSANAFLVKNGFWLFSFAPKISERIAIVVAAHVMIRHTAFIFLPCLPAS
jgi:hypothetical protein